MYISLRMGIHRHNPIRLSPSIKPEHGSKTKAAERSALRLNESIKYLQNSPPYSKAPPVPTPIKPHPLAQHPTRNISLDLDPPITAPLLSHSLFSPPILFAPLALFPHSSFDGFFFTFISPSREQLHFHSLGMVVLFLFCRGMGVCRL